MGSSNEKMLAKAIFFVKSLVFIEKLLTLFFNPDMIK